MPTARVSQLFIPTLKEAPADAVVVSHKLLVRAGFIRQLGAGVYDYLPLARRSLSKIEAILREEMAAIGAQEFYLPALHPAELWKESGRWDVMGDNMFRLKDRKHGDYCLGMTHEEIFTALARDELRSYRQLPQIWYQIQTKFRDEARPKSGLLRVRQFTMKDAYSFDVDAAGLDRSYENQRGAYERIFRRCGLSFVAVQAHSGSMGGAESSEFMVKTEAGEDLVAACASCGYAANLETAISRLTGGVDAPAAGPAPERFPTPGVVTIEALQRQPYGVGAARQLKTLVYRADAELVVAVVRGDHELNEAKLQTATQATDVRPATAEEIRPLMGANPGSLGAVAFDKAKVFLDEALVGRKNMVTGANEDGFHLKGVDVDRDIERAIAVSLRNVKAGEGCPKCDGRLEVWKALEIGHIFKLGTKYSVSLKANVLREDGTAVPLVMGSYGIGVERILAAAVELGHDAAGIVWPASIAPYHATVLTLGADASLVAAAEQVVDTLEAAGLEVLYDDRDERPGVKFKDADLVGIPLRISVGKKGLADGKIEWKRRSDSAVELVAIAELASRAKAWAAHLNESAR
jgi:prolyl-tRNA synthetase